MAANIHAPAAPAPRSARLWALAGLLVLFSSSAVAWLITLSSDAFARCLFYGENCNPDSGLMVDTFVAAFFGGILVAVTAIVLPARGPLTAKARWTLVWAQPVLIAAAFGAAIGIA